MTATIAPLPPRVPQGARGFGPREGALTRPVVTWPLLCAAALVLTIAAPHLGAGADADPESIPAAPGCVGCHHGDVEPAPEGGPAAAALKAIATLGLSAR